MPRPRSRLSRDYWLVWYATALSNLGDGIRLGALPLLTASITREPLPVTLVTALTFLPWVLFGAFGGVIVDRHDRRLLIMAGQAVRGVAVLALAIGVATDHVGLPAIYVVAFVIGLGELVVDTSSQAAIPMLVGPHELELANARIVSAQLVTNEVLGTPLGAFMFTAAAVAPFGLDAATFLAGALLVSLVRAPLQSERPVRDQRVVDDVRDGFRFLLGHPFLRPAMLAIALLNVSFNAMSSLFVLLVLDVFEAPGWAFGALVAVGAAGGFAGSLVAAPLTRRLGRRRALILSSSVGVAGESLIGLAPTVVVAALLYLVSAFAAIIGNIVAQSIRQEVTPDHLLGRVVASFRMVGLAGIPVGAVLGGVVAEVAGIRAVFAVAAGIGAVACGLLVRATTRLAPVAQGV